jgi:hypothetical protein
VEEKVEAPALKAKNTAVGIRCIDHATCFRKKLALILPTTDCRSVGIVRSQTQATGIF